MKLEFKQIPKERLLIYLLCLGIVPVALALLYNTSQNRLLSERYAIVSGIHQQAVAKHRKQALNKAVRELYANADHFYIDKYLESITPSQEEATDLAQLVRDDPSLPNRDLLRRLEFLEGAENRFRFATGSVETVAYMRESLERLIHPVEVRQEDLPLILARLEGRQLGKSGPGPHAPQLVVTELKLQRKRTSGDTEVFLLDLKLIKREFS